MTARVIHFPAAFNFELSDTEARELVYGFRHTGAPIKPAYPMAFPETVMPEFIRDDVADAVIDALALRNNPPPADANEYEVEFFDFMGYSDPVTLAPLELRF
jgi:hypothetical protein